MEERVAVLVQKRFFPSIMFVLVWSKYFYRTVVTKWTEGSSLTLVGRRLWLLVSEPFSVLANLMIKTVIQKMCHTVCKTKLFFFKYSTVQYK